MRFKIGTEVIYQNMTGIIDFICNNYVVIAIPSRINPARLVVYGNNYKDIEIIEK